MYLLGQLFLFIELIAFAFYCVYIRKLTQPGYDYYPSTICWLSYLFCAPYAFITMVVVYFVDVNCLQEASVCQKENTLNVFVKEPIEKIM